MTLGKSPKTIIDRNACQLHDEFLAALVGLHKRQITLNVEQILDRYLEMSNATPLGQIDKLKGWLDSFRLLSPIIVEEFKKLYDVRFTYNSNAIEGNTLTQSETELVLSKGITVGGKTLEEHLEVIGHKEAIDETLSGSLANSGEE